MTMARNIKHTPIGKRNDARQIFSTDTSKVPQAVAFVHRPLESQKKAQRNLSKHPSFVKFSEHKQDTVQHIADHYSSATSKLLQTQLSSKSVEGGSANNAGRKKQMKHGSFMVSGQSKFKIEKKTCDKYLS